MTDDQVPPLFQPIKMVEIELSRPIQTFENLAGYAFLKALVRLHGTPLGYVQLGVTNNRCPAAALSQAILDQHSWAIIRHLLNDELARPLQAGGLHLADLVHAVHPDYSGPFPLVTVAVCTRDRPNDLITCLNALSQLDYPAVDLLVIDNAPSSNATESLICTRYPQVRYIRETRPGLSWARNRAILEAQGEFIAYTDDDVIVDSNWVRFLAQVFVENPEVMAVTGLVVPYELETEAQILFEYNGGFGRGFERKWYRINREDDKRTTMHLGAGKFGTGANMAYRRSLFDRIGNFDPALGVGTVTQGGEDLEMFFRLLQEGYTLVYEPSALVYHRHRHDYGSLRRQIEHNNIGLAAYHLRSALTYPDQRVGFVQVHLKWLVQWHLKRLIQSLTRPHRFPLDLILAELQGYFVGLTRYFQSRRVAAEIVKRFGPMQPPAAINAMPADIPSSRQNLSGDLPLAREVVRTS